MHVRKYLEVTIAAALGIPPFIYCCNVTFEVYILSFKSILLSDSFHCFETWTLARRYQIHATGTKYERYNEGNTNRDRIKYEMFREGEIINLLIELEEKLL
jgi:hypothetical protein